MIRESVASDAAWRALADPTRRRLVELLRDGPRTTGELCRAFSTSRFAVMKHLRVLERGGLVVSRREGRKRWNTLMPEQLHRVGDRWAGVGPERVVAASPGPAPRSAASETVAESARAVERQTTGIFVDAVPWKVFDALTTAVAGWWGTPHMRSADASNLVLEPQPGGRFYEEWGHRQGALRGVVTAIRQDERLELSGPLFDEAESRLGFGLEAREGGTLLTVSSRRVAPEIVEDLFRVRLKAFVERGARSGVSR